ncbi:MAG: hypothetical protein AAFQ80_01400 [Cyanobacteria bacterium J06621_8]
MNKIDFSNHERISQLFQEAVDKAIEKHRQRGESIAISDENGKVKIITADEIPKLQQVRDLSKD